MAEIIKLAPGVSEVMRQRLGKIETVLTAEGVAGIQGIVEIDRDFLEALQYIHSAQTEMLAGNVHLAVQKYWDAYNLAVEKHGASLLSRQVVHSLVDSTIEVAKNAVERHNRTMNKKADITADIRTLPYNELMELQRAVAAEIQRREPKTRPAESPCPAQVDDAATVRALAGFEHLKKEFNNPATAKLPEPERVRINRQLVRAFERLQGRGVEIDTPPEVRAARGFLTSYNRRIKAAKLAALG